MDQNQAKWTNMLGVVLPHLPGEIFRAILVNFSQCFPHSLGSFRKFSPDLSLFLLILVNLKQAIQDKNARISYRQEGGAKQHRKNGPFWSFFLGSRECQNPVRNKVILTKMVVWWSFWTILVQHAFRQYRGRSLEFLGGWLCSLGAFRAGERGLGHPGHRNPGTGF